MRAIALSLWALVLALAQHHAGAFYLPGVAPMDFAKVSIML